MFREMWGEDPREQGKGVEEGGSQPCVPHVGCLHVKIVLESHPMLTSFFALAILKLISAICN